MRTSSIFWPCLFAASAACGGGVSEKSAAGADSSAPPPADSASQAPILAGTTWRLTELAGKPAPLGNDGKAATLELTAEDHRVAGFAGCNRMAGTYQLNGDSLRIGPLALTRMACMKGMELERDFAAALEQTRAYRISSQGLELLGGHGPLARLEAQ